jgi:hypothetical protein
LFFFSFFSPHTHSTHRMRRSALSSQREPPRRLNATRTGSSANTSSSVGAASPPATISAWVHPRLLDVTAQLLALQPDDPLRVLKARFSTEALLLTTYPETSATTAEKELEEENAFSLHATPCPPGPTAKPPNAFSSKGKGPSGRGGDARPCTTAGTQQQLERLVEHRWVRRRLQPYGLHAVVRSVCSPGQRQPTNPDADVIATAEDAQQQQWLECFALLHRQSRLSAAEKMAASHRAPQVKGSVLPPVDYRAVEEAPMSPVLLYVMCVIEAHVQSVDAEAEAHASPLSVGLLRRTQLSTKLLGLQLLAVSLRRQRSEMSDRGSSISSESENSALAAAKEDSEGPLSPLASSSDSPLELLYALPAVQLERFHQWLLERLQEVTICPDSAFKRRAAAPSQVSSRCPLDGPTSSPSPPPDLRHTTPLALLQSHVEEALRCILYVNDCSTVLPEAAAVISADTFVAFMRHLSSLLATQQSAVVSMAVTLSARVGRVAYCADASQAPVWRWVTTCLQQCTVRVMKMMFPGTDEVSPRLPPAWELHAHHIVDALSIFTQDAKGINEQRVQLALSRIAANLVAEERPCVSILPRAFKDIPSTVMITALVDEWLLRIFDGFILALSNAQ